jgi:hypothetical protein
MSLVGILAGIAGILMGALLMFTYSHLTRSQSDPLYRKVSVNQPDAFASTGYSPMSTRESEI